MPIVDVVIRLFALVVILLHLAAGFLPQETVWGLWPYATLPALVGWLAALVAASLAFRPVNRLAGRWLQCLWQAVPGKSHRRLWFAAVSIAMGCLFWILRIRHLRWGDAKFIVQALSYTGPDRPIWTIYNWQSPLTIYSHARLWLVLNPLTGIGVDTLYALSSVLAGIASVYVLLLIADSLGRNSVEKAIVFGLVVTTGSMQLFFGYVENYTLMSLGLVLTLYLGIQYIKQRTSLVWVSLVLAITNTLHPSTIVLWPAVVFLACRRPEPSRNAGWTRWVSVILPPILVFSALSAFMLSGGHGPGAMLRDDRPGGADGIPFVPLVRVTTEWQHYTMFSPAHFLDWLNEHVLISPFGLFLILVAIFVVLSRRKPNTPEDANQAESPDLTSSSRANTGIILFLGIASLVYVLLTFVWNPDYGGQQDWDLFAPSAFVYTLLAAQLLVQVVYGSPKATNKSQALAWIGQLLIATSALHTIAWVYSNTIP